MWPKSQPSSLNYDIFTEKYSFPSAGFDSSFISNYVSIKLFLCAFWDIA